MSATNATDLSHAQDAPAIGDLYDQIEANLWMVDSYFSRNCTSLAIEHLRDAWRDYVRFRDVLCIYANGDDLGERLRRALVSRAGDAAASLALVVDTPAMAGVA